MPAILDARSLQTSTLDAPVCIVGGGPMGLSVSVRLSELGIDHIVLESGGREPGDNQDLAGGENIGLEYEDLVTTRIRALGGTTHIWGGHCKPLRPEDFLPRAHIPNSGWPITFEEFAKHIGGACELVGLENKWRAADYGDFSAWLDPEAGFFDFEAFKLSQMNHNPSQWAKGDFFTANRSRIGARILTHATARRLLFDEAGRVAAVECAGGEDRPLQVRAKIFVVACGGIETARFLLINKRLAGGPLSALPALGRYFMEHPQVVTGQALLPPSLPEYFFGVREPNGEVNQMRFFLKDRMQRQHGLPSTMFELLRPETGGQGPADRVARLGAAAPIRSGIFAKPEQAPLPDRYVALSRERTDRLGDPVTQLHYFADASAHASLQETTRLFARELGLQGIGLARLTMGPPGEPAGGKDSNVGWQRHHMGTTRMGTDPATAVVDDQCRVFGVPNLYIGGTSVFPTGGCVNPTMNAIALCLRLASHIGSSLNA